MDGKKKKLAMLLIGKPSEEDDDEEDQGYSESDSEDLANEVLDAVRNNDAGALAAALKEFVKSC